jgi:UDP-N-acetylglucosamine 2-epimerase
MRTMKRILTVVGARPQFVKAAPVSRALRERHREFLLHTGQHYDDGMAGRFFRELGLPEPDRNLGVGSGTHAEQTARMLVGVEQAIAEWRPDLVLVYGDTNSTVAGALAAAKMGCPIAHVEAGLRSFERTMPEEINRVVADHLAAVLFCPGEQAARNLALEGITAGVHVVGDVMVDQLEAVRDRIARSTILDELGLEERGYILATVHRAATVDDPARLASVVGALGRLERPVVFPVHPRTRAALETRGQQTNGAVRTVAPVGYLDMLRLQQSARLVVTDSGGVQKEAYWLGVPCVTLRDRTEWTETVDAGWNVLAGTDPDRIVDAARTLTPPTERPPLYGTSGVSRRIVERLGSELG